MDLRFADRMNNAQKSFIREILKVVGNPEIISFATSPKLVPYPVTPAVRLLCRLTDSSKSLMGTTVKSDTAIKPLMALSMDSLTLPFPF